MNGYDGRMVKTTKSTPTVFELRNIFPDLFARETVNYQSFKAFPYFRSNVSDLIGGVASTALHGGFFSLGKDCDSETVVKAFAAIVAKIAKGMDRDFSSAIEQGLDHGFWRYGMNAAGMDLEKPDFRNECREAAIFFKDRGGNTEIHICAYVEILCEYPTNRRIETPGSKLMQTSWP